MQSWGTVQICGNNELVFEYEDNAKVKESNRLI